jgi:hypothetical protein
MTYNPTAGPTFITPGATRYPTTSMTYNPTGGPSGPVPRAPDYPQ